MGIIYKSNLEPVVAEKILADRTFLSHIHDLKALRQYMEKFPEERENLTPLQNEEYEISQHCVYAAKGDYPYGTVRTSTGLEVVCKCTNTKCKLFSQCRPDFVETELKVQKDNNSKQNVALLTAFASATKWIEELTKDAAPSATKAKPTHSEGKAPSKPWGRKRHAWRGGTRK